MVKQICETCEFYQGVCCGNSELYGKKVKPTFSCEEWELSFEVFQICQTMKQKMLCLEGDY